MEMEKIMYKLEIIAKNFRSYPSFEWNLADGLFLVDGINVDTKGGNGSGKSSLFDSWAWARYGWLPRWGGSKSGFADAVMRRKDGETVDHTLVKVIERFTSDTIEITRERPSKLTVIKNGEELRGIDQKGLDQLLDMDAERFFACVYIPQGRGRRSFYMMGDADRMELLSVISDLRAVDRSFERAKSRKREIENERTAILTRLSVFDSQIAEIPRTLEKTEKDVLQVLERLILIKKQVEVMGKDIFDKKEIAQKLMEERISEKNNILKSEVMIFDLEITDIKNKLINLEKELSSLPVLEPIFTQKIFNIKREIATIEATNRLAEEIKMKNIALENEMRRYFGKKYDLYCNECNQPLPDDIKDSLKEKDLLEIGKLKSSIKKFLSEAMKPSGVTSSPPPSPFSQPSSTGVVLPLAKSWKYSREIVAV